MTLVKFFQTKNTLNFQNKICENLHGMKAGRAPMLVYCKIPIHSLLKFQILETLAMPVFSNKSPEFRYLLTFTCSFHAWKLQCAKVGFPKMRGLSHLSA